MRVLGVELSSVAECGERTASVAGLMCLLFRAGSLACLLAKVLDLFSAVLRALRESAQRPLRLCLSALCVMFLRLWAFNVPYMCVCEQTL